MSIKEDCLNQAERVIFRRKCRADDELAERTGALSRSNKAIADALSMRGKIAYELFNAKVSGSTAKDIEKIMMRQTENRTEIAVLLEKSGLPADYLTSQYTCKKCSDTGFLPSGEMCSCLKEIYGDLLCHSFNNVIDASGYSFGNFSLDFYREDENAFHNMQTVLEFCHNYAESFSPSSGGILMFGNTGLGKTHLSLAIANMVLESGFSVVYDSAQYLFEKITNEHFQKNSQDQPTSEIARSCDLLIIDDLGCEYSTAFYQSAVHSLVDSRILAGRPTIISTNLTLEELTARYTDRMVSRIVGNFEILRFEGRDIRFAKKINERK